ncbi:unnamed protein product [Boreogadus saida]
MCLTITATTKQQQHGANVYSRDELLQHRDRPVVCPKGIPSELKLRRRGTRAGAMVRNKNSERRARTLIAELSQLLQQYGPPPAPSLPQATLPAFPSLPQAYPPAFPSLPQAYPPAFPSLPQATPPAFPSLPQATPPAFPSLPQAYPPAFPSLPQAYPPAFPSLPQATPPAFPSFPSLHQLNRPDTVRAGRTTLPGDHTDPACPYLALAPLPTPTSTSAQEDDVGHLYPQEMCCRCNSAVPLHLLQSHLQNCNSSIATMGTDSSRTTIQQQSTWSMRICLLQNHQLLFNCRQAEPVKTNTVSLRERQIPTVGKGTLASVTDGKGTLCRRSVTGKVPFAVFCIRNGGCLTTSLIDAVSIFPIG